MKTLFIFDFDGTLADTSPLHAQSFLEVLQPFDIDVNYEMIAGLRTREAILKLFHYSSLPTPDDQLLQSLILSKQSRVRELISRHLTPLPDVQEFLSWSSTHFDTCLVTSGSRATVTHALNKLNLTSYFQYMLFSEDVSLAKPHPEGFLAALNHFGAQPFQALIFEDSAAGFQAANIANIDYIDVTATPLRSVMIL